MKALLRRRPAGGPPEEAPAEDRPASRAGAALRPDPFKRHVNELIEAIEAAASSSIGFVCECADPCCLRTVWLAGLDYQARRAEPGWTVRAPEHEPA